MSRLIRNKKVVGGTTNRANGILYEPADTSRTQTDVETELDKINGDLTELEPTRIYPAAVSNISSINMAQCYRMGSLAIINIAISVTDPSQGASCRVDAIDGYTFKTGQSYMADCYSGWSYTEQHFISTVISGSSITFQAPNSPYVALHCVAVLEKV